MGGAAIMVRPRAIGSSNETAVRYIWQWPDRDNDGEYDFNDKDNRDERGRLDRNDLEIDDNENSTRTCRSKGKQTSDDSDH
eukprot:8099699-Heterocapsa_arctica.AAC.1